MTQGALQKIIEHIVLYFNFSENWVPPVSPDHEPIPGEKLAFTKVPLNYFDGADITLHDADALAGAAISYERLFVDGRNPRELLELIRAVGYWDVTTAIPVGNGDAWKQFEARTGQKALMAFQRHRRAHLSEVRNLFPITSGIVCDYAHVMIGEAGHYRTLREYDELRGGEWFAVGQPRECEVQKCHEAEQITLSMAPSVALTQSYDWTVRFRVNPRMPSVALPTDPEGARRIFKDREAPPDRDRRAALRHWVEQHYRRGRGEDADPSLILPFLRGRCLFKWHDYECEIVVSEYDRKRCAKYDSIRVNRKQARR